MSRRRCTASVSPLRVCLGKSTCVMSPVTMIFEPDQVKRYMENDIIEIVPLAYMRGRTLNQAVMILDEGQNTTVPQMKMFLTRMGTGSKIIVTGDVTQVDLPKQTRSGLADAVQRLRDIDRIALIYLDESDIVRQHLGPH